MMTFEDFIAPVTPEEFREVYQGRKPLHIPATDPGTRRSVLDWASFNHLMNQTDIWSAHTLRLVNNRVAVDPSEYCVAAQRPTGQILLPVPAKVAMYLADGASVIANEVQALHPQITQAAAVLSRTFAAQVAANVYCSFKDVQAFGPHYDCHDVFAVQTEGEKVWRIYKTRIDTPVDMPPAGPDTQRWLEQTHGPLVSEIRMRPGDVLYIPRGQFHDALAVDGPSLHVTFSVTALYGRVLLTLLDHVAMQFPSFRSYFPPADEAGGQALTTHLATLATLLKDLVSSPAFRDEVAMSQERLVRRPASFTLPERASPTRYRVTGRPFPPSGTALQVAWAWCADQMQFSVEQLVAAFDFIAEPQLREGVELALAAGALERLS